MENKEPVEVSNKVGGVEDDDSQRNGAKRTLGDSGDADGSQEKEKKSRNGSLDGAKNDDESSKNVQNLQPIGCKQEGIRILTRIVDYYFNQWRCPLDPDSNSAKDFVKNWLKIADVTQFMQKVQRLKRDFKMRVENKGKNWVFFDLVDLEFVKLADFIWGVNGISKSSDYEENNDNVDKEMEDLSF